MKKLIALILGLALGVSAHSQSNIKVQAPNLVDVNEQFKLAFVIDSEKAPSSFEWEGSEDFQIVWGPQTGTSKSISIVNGKTTRSAQTTYSYILMPKKAGKFTLPAARAEVDGRLIASRSVSIEVVGGDTAQTVPQSREESPRENIFMRLVLSKSDVVVGESLSATLKLYQRANISGFEDAKFPSFDGFWSQEIQSPSNIEFQRENVGGEIYNSAVLRRWSLVAQQAGTIRIDPAELICLVNVRTEGGGGGSFFDSFFQDEYRTVRQRVSSGAVGVTVRKLPAGAPDSFCGAVGKFRMNAALTRDSLKMHDAASLKVRISGKGNLALLEAPKINFPPDFEVYDVKSSDIADGKEFEYPFIPRGYGAFTIGPVAYSYYDVSAGKYVTLTSDPLEISVSRVDAEDSPSGRSVVAQAPSKKDVKDLGNDIRYISAREPDFTRSDRFFAGSVLFLIIVLFITLGAVSLFFFIRRYAAKKADVAGTKRSGATKMARKRLSSAGMYLQKNLVSAFYEELHRALLGYVADKLSIDMSDMSKENIASKLTLSGASAELAGRYVALLDACEFARYSPTQDSDAMKTNYDEALSVISEIDGNMKKSHKPAGLASLVIIMALVPFGMRAAQTDSLWRAGVEAYSAADYQGSVEAWESIVESGVQAPELFYNIGNARFKLQEYGKAIVAYKRALRLDPSLKDAEFNMEFVQSKCIDNIETIPEFFLKTWVRDLRSVMSSDVWAILFILAFALTLAMGLLLVFGNTPARRKTGFYSGIVLAVVAILALSFSISQKNACLSEDEAVVMTPTCPVKSSPGTESVDLFVLHEGTCVEILETIGEWVNISLEDGRQGWIMVDSVEIL